MDKYFCHFISECETRPEYFKFFISPAAYISPVNQAVTFVFILSAKTKDVKTDLMQRIQIKFPAPMRALPVQVGGQQTEQWQRWKALQWMELGEDLKSWEALLPYEEYKLEQRCYYTSSKLQKILLDL